MFLVFSCPLAAACSSLANLPLAMLRPWAVPTWPTYTGVTALCLAMLAGCWYLLRQRRSLEQAWGEIGRVWEQGLARATAVGDIVPDMLCELDENRTLTFANRAFFQITGYGEMDLQKGLNVIDLLVPTERPQLNRDLETARDGGRLGVRTYHLRRAGGDALAVALHLAPMLERGEVTGWRAVLQDVEQRRSLRAQTRTPLPAVEGVIHGILKDLAQMRPEQHDDAMARALAAAGLFLGADRCYQYRISAAGGRLESRQLWYADGVTPLAEDQVLPGLDEYPWLQERFERGDCVRITDVHSLPAGAWVERDRWTRQGITAVMAVPLRSEGRVVGLLGCEVLGQRREWDDRELDLFESIAEICLQAMQRDTAAQRLHDANRRLLGIVELLPDPACVIDMQGAIVACNPALEELTGIAASVAGADDGRDGLALLLADAHALVADAQAGIPIDARRTREVHVPGLRDGVEAYLQLTAQPLRDGTGALVGCVQIVQDVTAHRQSEQRAATRVWESERKAQTARRQRDEAFGALLEVTERTWERMVAQEQATAVRLLLDGLVATPVTVDLGACLADAVAPLQARCQDRHVVISVDCPTGLALRADPAQLDLLVSRLVNDSLDHACQDLLVGEIHVRARRHGDDIVIEYDDTGDRPMSTRPTFGTRLVHDLVTGMLDGGFTPRTSRRGGSHCRITLPAAQSASREHGAPPAACER